MGHIGGDRSGRVDPMAQRLRHVVKRAGQEADFVAAGGKPRHRDLPCPAQTDTQRGAPHSPERARVFPRPDQSEESGENDLFRLYATHPLSLSPYPLSLFLGLACSFLPPPFPPLPRRLP